MRRASITVMDCYDATSSDLLRVAYHAALADARNALVALADASTQTLAEITEALRADAPDRAASIIARVLKVKTGAQALAGAAVDLIWKQQPVANEFESVLMMYELAIDYQRLADDLAALAADVRQAGRATLRSAPPHLNELADAALRASAHIHEGLRDGTAGPLLRANTEGAIADALYVDGIAELQHALLTRTITAESACALLTIVMAFQRVLHQAATAARHGGSFLAEIG